MQSTLLSSRLRLVLGSFLIFNFTFLISVPAHAQFKILSSPTGNCPKFQLVVPPWPLPTGARETPSALRTAGQALLPSNWVDGVDTTKSRVATMNMQCKQGLCYRPATSGGAFDLKTDIPCNYSVDDIFVTIMNVVRAIFAITGSLALLMFIYGGLKWILSAGNPNRVKEGKDIIVNSLIAIVITFGAGAIVTFVVKGIGGNSIAIEGSGGAIGTITFAPAQCPAGGKDGEPCKNTTQINMKCDYGSEINEGGIGKTEGQCISVCEYETRPPDATLDTNYQCVDKNLLSPVQKGTCKQGLCPGADNIQCCKL